MDILNTEKILKEIYRAEKRNDWSLVEMLLYVQQKRAEINRMLQKIEKYKAGELCITAGD